MKGIITNWIHLSLNIYVYECKCAYNNACTFMHLCKRSLKRYMDMLVYKWKRGKTVEVNITPSDPQRLPDDLTEIALRKNRRSAQRRRRKRRKRPGRMINSRAPFMATLRAAQPQQRPTKADPSPSLPPHPQKQPLTRGNPSFLLLLHFFFFLFAAVAVVVILIGIISCCRGFLFRSSGPPSSLVHHSSCIITGAENNACVCL